MTKRNAHALQRRYTKLLARTTAVTSARLQFGQGVTGRRPWSVWLSMLGPHRVPHGTCQLNHKRFAPSCGTSGPVARPKSLHAIPLVYLVRFTRGALWHRRSRMAIAQALVCALRATAGGLSTGTYATISRDLGNPPPTARSSSPELRALGDALVFRPDLQDGSHGATRYRSCHSSRRTGRVIRRRAHTGTARSWFALITGSASGYCVDCKHATGAG